MNLRAKFRIKLLLISGGAGAALVLVLFVVGETGMASNLAQTLLSPGLLLAGLAGFGAHDMGALALTILGDILFYGGLAFAVLSGIIAPPKVSDR